jgi:hypothetical protein
MVVKKRKAIWNQNQNPNWYRFFITGLPLLLSEASQMSQIDRLIDSISAPALKSIESEISVVSGYFCFVLDLELGSVVTLRRRFQIQLPKYAVVLNGTIKMIS